MTTNIPGKLMSCHAEGSVSDWKLCSISVSNGRGGWKKSDKVISIPKAFCGSMAEDDADA